MIVKFHPDVKRKDFKNVDNSIKKLFLKALEKIKNNPLIWKELKTPLWGFRKMYFADKKFRIVYKIKNNIIYIIAVGKRENKLVYKNTQKRI